MNMYRFQNKFFMHEFQKESFIKYEGLSVPLERVEEHRQYFIENFNLLKPIKDIPAVANRQTNISMPGDSMPMSEEEKEVMKQLDRLKPKSKPMNLKLCTLNGNDIIGCEEIMLGASTRFVSVQ